MRSRALALFLLPSLAVAVLLRVDPARAQGNCGEAGGVFQIDGQFYSLPGLVDWAQGAGGQGVFDAAGNPVLSPSLYDRDPHNAGSAKDPTTFTGNGNKNNDDISLGENPWSWGEGSSPQKNDLTDVYAYSDIIGGHVWLFLGAATRATNGASHIDFEFNQMGFQRTGTASGQVIGLGSQAGRTAGVDFIVSVDFEDGGTSPVASFRTWEWTGSDYAFVLSTPDSTQVLTCTNIVNVPAPPWGAVAPDGSPSNTVVALQFVEIALDLTGLEIDPSVFCTDVSTLLFKTRSAPSFTSALQDMALYQFSILPPPDCTITADANPLCEGESTLLCAPVPPDGANYTYHWDGPGGPYGDQRCITVDTGGEYSLWIEDNLNGCDSDTCGITLAVNAIPVCGITADDTVICDGQSAQFCGPQAPGGTTYSYAWGGPGGPWPDQRCIDVTEPGTYTLVVTDTGTGCASEQCSQDLTVNPLPPCSITGDTVLCDGSSGELCGPEGEYTWAWTGPGGPYDTRCITVTEAGVYTLTVGNPATGCAAPACSTTVSLVDNPVCSIEGPDSICPGGEEMLCGPEGDYVYAWSGPGGPYPNQRCITVTGEGTYMLTVGDGNGCSAACEKTLTLDVNVTAGQVADVAACTGDPVEFCVTASGTGPITYQWARNGVDIPGADEDCYSIASLAEGQEGTYTVTVTGKCNTVTRSAELELADVRVVGLRDLYLCIGQPAELCPVVTGRGPFTYQWQLDGQDIPGADDSCLVIGAVDDGDEGEYTVIVTGFCGPPDTDSAFLYVGDCVEYCGLTQGFWGNYGGKFGGVPTIDLLRAFVTPGDPLTVGVLGTRSVTLHDGAEDCIVQLLPGGGPPKALKNGLGDAVVDPASCDTNPPIADKHGRIHNILHAQTMTLDLNTHLDPTLPDLPVCEFMIMIPALPGPDGILGTGDDVPDNDHPRFGSISPQVLDALDALGLPHTAGSVLALCNRVLAGNLPGGVNVNPSAASGAAGTINEITDECAFTIHCASDGGPGALALAEPPAEEESPHERRRSPSNGDGVARPDRVAESQDARLTPGAFRLAPVAPNPFRGPGVVRFELPEASRVRLTVFGLSGRVLGTLVDGDLGAGTHAAELVPSRYADFAPGVYFIRMEARGLETGLMHRETRKAVLVP